MFAKDNDSLTGRSGEQQRSHYVLHWMKRTTAEIMLCSPLDEEDNSRDHAMFPIGRRGEQ